MRGLFYRGPANEYALGESSRLHQVFPEPGTHGLVAALAERTMPARYVMGHDDTVAGFEPNYPGAGFDDLAHQFMTQHGLGWGQAIVQLEEIRSAQTNHAQLQQQLSRTGAGYGPVLQTGQRPALASDDRMGGW